MLASSLSWLIFDDVDRRGGLVLLTFWHYHKRPMYISDGVTSLFRRGQFVKCCERFDKT